MAVVKDCAARYRELITARIAVVLVALRGSRNALALAAPTGNAVRPAQSRKMFSGFFVTAKTFESS